MLTMKERKLRYIGHIMREDRYEVLRLFIERKIQGDVNREKAEFLAQRPTLMAQ